MKKSLIALNSAIAMVLASAAFTAQAADTGTFLVGKPTVTAGYERTEVNGVNGASNNQGKLTLKNDTVLGLLDISVSADRTAQGNVSDTAQRFEAGYTIEGAVGIFDLKTRFAVGNASGLKWTPHGSKNSTYGKSGVELSLPITHNVTGFTGFEFSKAFDGETENRLRTYAGADYALDEKNVIRASYVHDRIGGGKAIANGFQVAFSHKY